ncbi:unnamed protein product [Prorocentrum cordatum]|uniref:Uncharacterized protein n=1 Tax=Prorocentrum cordatum TaxID=2364126 RepID=A0ABN9PVA6_9DINO|nr:unnamed protein product [Polarella glacialis]
MQTTSGIGSVTSTRSQVEVPAKTFGDIGAKLDALLGDSYDPFVPVVTGYIAKDMTRAASSQRWGATAPIRPPRSSVRRWGRRRCSSGRTPGTSEASSPPIGTSRRRPLRCGC